MFNINSVININDKFNINMHNTLIDIINIQRKKEINNNIWKNSIYKDLPLLQSNNVGIVGEMLIQKICKDNNIISSIDGAKTKTEKIGDGFINNKSVEIKTSHLGCSGNSFQHELGEFPWNSNYIIFIDVSPTIVYIVIFKNFTENEYKQNNFKCIPYFPTKSITRRKKIGNFKLDTSININEKCVLNGYAIKTNNFKSVSKFIKNNII